MRCPRSHAPACARPRGPRVSSPPPRRFASIRTRLSIGAILVTSLAACLPEGGPPQVGETVPEYEAPTLAGEMVSLTDLRGQVVLLNVWATWCGPCRFETPFLQSVYAEHQERGFEILGVSVDDAGFEDTVQEFADENSVTYTILHDSPMQAMDTFHVIGLPATYLIDREGVIRFIRLGPVSEQDQQFWTALEEALG